MKKIFSILFILLGITSVILGLICYNAENDHGEIPHISGSELYPGIQDGVAQTANNVQYLTEVTAFGFGSVLTVGGVFMLVFGIKTLNSTEKTQKKDEEAAPSANNEAEK